MEVHKESVENTSCNVWKCLKCSPLSENKCIECDVNEVLTDDGKCDGWMTIFKQIVPNYMDKEDWKSVNADHWYGKFLDSFSMLDQIDDTMRNSKW